MVAGGVIYRGQFVEAGEEFVEGYDQFLGSVLGRQVGEVFDVSKQDVGEIGGGRFL